MIPFDPTATAQRDMVRAAINNVKSGGPLLPPQSNPPVTTPRAYFVVAWRHDGEVRKTSHISKEVALEFARSLHWAIVYKYAVMDGRDMVVRELINAPAG